MNSLRAMKKVLFIDRDGTLLQEPEDEQVDSLSKVAFVPGMIRALTAIRERSDYRFVMVSNQDGLGTPAFPEESFWPVQNLLINTLRGEGIEFDDIYIDRHFPADNSPARKPGTAMLTSYTDESCDLANSYVIGDRETDAQLARNLGCRSILLGPELGWDKVAEVILAGERATEVHRRTGETDIYVRLDPDRPGEADISTGLPFLDHMLRQIAVHGALSLTVHARGDLEVDEHHTMEDTALALGEGLRLALGDKIGIQRYGYCLPMDDSLCRVALDFGGRPWLVWDVEIRRDEVGHIPADMFYHFFKSLSDAALMNLNISARGMNDHHCIEAVFKAFARALRMAVRRDIRHLVLPSSKGTL